MKKKPFHVIRSAGIEFTEEQWADYCQATRKNDLDKIKRTFGKYTFNDFDICLTPDKKIFTTKGGACGYNATLEIAGCGNGLWSFGCDIFLGTEMQSFGASWTDKPNESYCNGFPSQKECEIAGWRFILERIGEVKKNARKSPKMQLRQMIENELKRLTRPQVVQLDLFNF